MLIVPNLDAYLKNICLKPYVLAKEKKKKVWWYFNLFFYYFEKITSLQKFTGRAFLPILFKSFENEFAYLMPIIPEYFSVHLPQTRTSLL